MPALGSTHRMLLLVACGVVAALAILAARRVDPAASAGTPGRLTYDASVAPADRAAIEASIARTRPEARTLIARIAGDTTIRNEETGGDTVGLTEGVPGRWTVTLDLPVVTRRWGARGVDRVVLHEFGHVIDFATLTPGQQVLFEQGIPRGWGCDQGHSGACADRAERFAESFAKWATSDLGIDLDVGYKVPPPTGGLEAWGAPLTALATAR